MDGIINGLEVFKGAWPAIQPAISTVFGAVIARLFLRGNTTKTEIEKIKQAKFSDIADTLLEEGHITHLEYYKCRNFNKIAKKADKVYQQNQSNSSGKDANRKNSNFSEDWFVRFFEDAGNIGDEQMQELWAKVLAGEIGQPGSFSLRTLDILKNLSKNEAETLEEIASYALTINGGSYICIDESLQAKYNYRNKLLTMYDCGIIENNIASHYNLTMNTAGLFMVAGSLICMSHNQSAEKYSQNIQRFTNTGCEFIRLVTPNEAYSMDYFKEMNNKFPKLELTVHRIINFDGNAYQYDEASLL